MAKVQNTILDYLKGCDGGLYGRIVRTLKVYRGIDFEAIGQEDVMVVSPEEAMKYGGKEGDKYFKVWMAGERIAWCTWANTLVDSKFRWNAKTRGENKRDNGDLLGNEPYVSRYLKSYDAAGECSIVFMFPFEAFNKADASNRNVEKKRAEKRVSAGGDDTAKRVRELLDDLSSLSVDVSKYKDSDRYMRDFAKECRAEFDNKLMELECIEPGNRMVEYYRQLQQKWDKTEVSAIEQIINIREFGITAA